MSLSDPGFYCIKTAERSYTGVIRSDESPHDELPTKEIRPIMDPEQIKEQLDRYWR